MIEIIIATIIVLSSIFIIVKSLKNSSKGKCNSGCNSCKADKACSQKNSIKINKNRNT